MRIFSFIMLLVFLSAGPVFADSKESLVKKGKAGFEKKDYAGSLKFFEKALKKDPESPEINFNAGTAGYKAGHYKDAISYLQKGLLSNDPEVRKNSHYNLGITNYALAEKLENSFPSLALAYAQNAKKEFETVLKYDDKDKDALYNYDNTIKKEEEIKKKLPKKKGVGGKGNDQSQDENSKDKNGDGTIENQKGSEVSSQSQGEQNLSERNNNIAASQEQQEKEYEKESKEQGFSRSLGDKEKNETSEKQGRHGIKPGQMDKEEARSLIRQFEQSNEATGLLNFDKKSSAEEKPVLKDW